MQLRRRANGMAEASNEAAERFMAKWHRNEAQLCRSRHASDSGGPHGNRKEGDNSRRESAVHKSGKEIADRVARYHADRWTPA